MFGLVGDISLQGRQPSLVSVARNKSSPIGFIIVEFYKSYKVHEEKFISVKYICCAYKNHMLSVV